MIVIDYPNEPAPSLNIALGGQSYVFEFWYNKTNQSVYLNIYQNQQLLCGGVKLVEGSLPLKKHSLTDFLHGELFLCKNFETTEKPSMHNIGVGKAYYFWYIPYLTRR